MVFDKAKLIQRMKSKDKRVKDLTATEIDDIIHDGLKLVQRDTSHFTFQVDVDLSVLNDGNTHIISQPTMDIQNIWDVSVTSTRAESGIKIDIDLVQKDNYDIEITGDGSDYTGFTMTITYLYYPPVSNVPDYNLALDKLLRLAVFLEMYKFFDDEAREAQAERKYDDELGSNSLDIIRQFQSIPIGKGLQ